MELSVVMAVRNQAKTLDRAIASIVKQTYVDWLFYIVDDQSQDQTPAILQRWQTQDKRIRVITNRQQLGLTRSLNLAWRQVKTKLIARMDGDDESLPNRFSSQIKFLHSHPHVSLLGTAAILIDSSGQKLRVKTMPTTPSEIRRVILSSCPFIHPTWIVRQSVLAKVGGYNPDFAYAQDYELALRLVSRFEAANLAEPLIRYRVNSAAAISLKNLKRQEFLALKARLLALNRYGYSWVESWRLIKPLLSFCLPLGIKKVIYRHFYWRHDEKN